MACSDWVWWNTERLIAIETIYISVCEISIKDEQYLLLAHNDGFGTAVSKNGHPITLKWEFFWRLLFIINHIDTQLGCKCQSSQKMAEDRMCQPRARYLKWARVYILFKHTKVARKIKMGFCTLENLTMEWWIVEILKWKNFKMNDNLKGILLMYWVKTK